KEPWCCACTWTRAAYPARSTSSTAAARATWTAPRSRRSAAGASRRRCATADRWPAPCRWRSTSPCSAEPEAGVARQHLEGRERGRDVAGRGEAHGGARELSGHGESHGDAVVGVAVHRAALQRAAAYHRAVRGFVDRDAQRAQTG